MRILLPQGPALIEDRQGATYAVPSCAEPTAQEIFIFGAVERSTRDFIVNCLPEHGTYVDVGANIGALAIPVARARPEASIVCLEADPIIHSILKANLHRNDCERVQALSCVVGEVDGDAVSFYRAPNDKFGMGSLGPQFDAAPIMLKRRTLDSLLAEIDIHSVDVMKIDVEGAELGVLRGAQQLLSSDRAPVLVFEFIDWAEARNLRPTARRCAESFIVEGF